MCPIACLPNPLEHITHTYHTENLLEAESSMCTHTLAQTFMLSQDSLHTVCAEVQGPRAFCLCLSFLFDKRSKTKTLISLCLVHKSVGVCSPVCISTDETEKSDNHVKRSVLRQIA